MIDNERQREPEHSSGSTWLNHWVSIECWTGTCRMAATVRVLSGYKSGLVHIRIGHVQYVWYSSRWISSRLSIWWWPDEFATNLKQRQDMSANFDTLNSKSNLQAWGPQAFNFTKDVDWSCAMLTRHTHARGTSSRCPTLNFQDSSWINLESSDAYLYKAN